MVGAAAELDGLADPAVADDEDAVRVGRRLRVVGDEDDGLAALVARPPQRVEQLGAGRVVEVAGRLVGEEEGRAGSRARGRRPPAAARRSTAGPAGGAPCRYRSTSSMTSRTRSASSPRDGSWPAIVKGSATFSVTSRSGMRLNDWNTNPVRSRRRRVARSSDSRLTTSPSRMTSPGGRPIEPAEQLQERALATARRTHERDELAGLDGQGDAAQGVDGRLAERIGLREVAGLEDGAARAHAAWRAVSERAVAASSNAVM